jgi:hypothetical protein
MGNSSKASTMADGSLRLQIDIMPKDVQIAFKMFGTTGTAIALAPLKDEVAVEQNRPGKSEKPTKGPYGEWAKALVQSGFFRTPKVWQGIGPDTEFLEWVKTQKSAKSKEFSQYDDTGECYCVPAHVRHLELGSGTGIKPEYAAIPLTKEEHDLSHLKGDIAIGDREWWDKQRIKYVSLWAYETLKKKMNYDSYTDMPPRRLLDWATQRGIEDQLPVRYHTAETQDGETEVGQTASTN